MTASGPTHWLLLRGLTRESRHWGDFPGRLAAALPGRQVTPLDLPGNGEFFAQTSPASVARLTDFVRLQAQARAPGAPWGLLGMSLGGMVAVDWAARFPQEVGRLVLVNTSLRPFSSPARRLRPQNWARLARLMARWPDPGSAAAIETDIHRMTCRPGAPAAAKPTVAVTTGWNAPGGAGGVGGGVETVETVEAIEGVERLERVESVAEVERVESTDLAGDIATWTAIRHSAPVSAASARRQLWAAARFGGGAEAPACPALVLSSDGDRLVHPDCSRLLATAWQAPLALHPDAGHDLPHDAPDWVCAQVAAWLNEGAAQG